MRSAINAILVAVLLSYGVTQLMAPPDGVLVRKVPKPPDCPDCGVGAKIVRAE